MISSVSLIRFCPTSDKWNSVSKLQFFTQQKRSTVKVSNYTNGFLVLIFFLPSRFLVDKTREIHSCLNAVGVDEAINNLQLICRKWPNVGGRCFLPSKQQRNHPEQIVQSPKEAETNKVLSDRIVQQSKSSSFEVFCCFLTRLSKGSLLSSIPVIIAEHLVAYAENHQMQSFCFESIAFSACVGKWWWIVHSFFTLCAFLRWQFSFFCKFASFQPSSWTMKES